MKIVHNEKGFTLIELMVVVAIMAVLATMVMGGVTGTGTSAEKSQVMNDASSLKSAVTNYNNSAIDQSWPTKAITGSTDLTFKKEGFTFLDSSELKDKVIKQSRLANLATAASNSMELALAADYAKIPDTYQVINWKAQTSVRQKQGSVALAALVPDFLDAPPDSTRLLSGTSAESSSGKLPEYLWLLKKGSALDADARSVQVWHLDDTEGINDADRNYIRIYPKIQ